jgi:hypothetical protein
MTVNTSPVIELEPTIIRRNTVGRVSIEVTDCDGNPADVTELRLRIVDEGDCPVYEEDFFQTYIAPFYHRIVKIAGVTGQYYIDFGDKFWQAQITGVGGTYPTGFLGGETVLLQIDNQVQTVTFQSSDQSLIQVVARINSVFGPIFGIPIAIAQVSGQLQIISKRRGRGAIITVLGGTALAILGLTQGTIVNGSERIGESDGTKTWLFEWTVTTGPYTSAETKAMQVVWVLPGIIYQMIPQLRLEIDKALKLVNRKEGLFLGYTDVQLLQYFIGGLQTINAYQPSIFWSLDTYPYQLVGSILVKAALMWGVTSQTLFAIDTDVPSYSDQGQSFVINHQPALAAYLQSVTSWLDTNVPLMKLHFVRSGSVYTQMMPNFRLQFLTEAAPNGSTFRNVITAGPG